MYLNRYVLIKHLPKFWKKLHLQFYPHRVEISPWMSEKELVKDSVRVGNCFSGDGYQYISKITLTERYTEVFHLSQE